MNNGKLNFPLNDGFAAIVPRITGGISTASSVTLLYLIWRSDSKLSTIYHRIMFAIGIADFLSSTAISLSTLPMDKEFKDGKLAEVKEGLMLGNKETCQVQGILFVFGTYAMFLYNGSLCVYYACVIAFRMKDYRIKKWVEPFMHAVPITFAIVICLRPLYSSLRYTPSPRESWCSLAETVKNTENKDFYDLLFTTTISTLLGLIFSCFGLIIWRVMQTQRFLRSTMDNSTMENSQEAQTNNSKFNPQQCAQLTNITTKQSINYTKVIVLQAMAYITSFLVTLSTPFVRSLIKKELLWIVRFQLILMPLQGLFNLMIYIGIRVYNYRRVHPEDGRFKVFKMMLKGKANDDVLIDRISLVHTDSNTDVQAKSQVLHDHSKDIDGNDQYDEDIENGSVVSASLFTSNPSRYDGLSSLSTPPSIKTGVVTQNSLTESPQANDTSSKVTNCIMYRFGDTPENIINQRQQNQVSGPGSAMSSTGLSFENLTINELFESSKHNLDSSSRYDGLPCVNVPPSIQRGAVSQNRMAESPQTNDSLSKVSKSLINRFGGGY